MDIQDYNDILGPINDFTSDVRGSLAAGTFVTIVFFALVLMFFILTYVFNSLQHLYAGRKAGRTEDWMAFVPFARTIYRLRMLGQPIWMMFLLGESAVYAYLLNLILSAINATFAMVVVVLYLLACLAYNVYYRRLYFRAFGISPHLGLLLISFVGVFVLRVMDVLIAFTHTYSFVGIDALVYVPTNVPVKKPTRDSVNTGGITGLTGMYANQDIQIAPGEEIVIGRDSNVSNVIISQNAEKVSRKHCSIQFDAETNSYRVVDHSSNGTFIDGGNRLVAGIPTSLSRGTVLALGNRENRFKLN